MYDWLDCLSHCRSKIIDVSNLRRNGESFLVESAHGRVEVLRLLWSGVESCVEEVRDLNFFFFGLYEI